MTTAFHSAVPEIAELESRELSDEQLEQVAGGSPAVLVAAAAGGFAFGATVGACFLAGVAVGYATSNGVKAAPDGTGCTEHGRTLPI